jgi:streptogramin lyase
MLQQPDVFPAKIGSLHAIARHVSILVALGVFSAGDSSAQVIQTTVPIITGFPATGAGLLGPRGIHMRPNGDLYIADWGHKQVRRVNYISSQVTVIAGNGLSGFSGEGGSAIDASFQDPWGVAVHEPSGDTYISDRTRVVRVDASTGILTTIAGDGTWGYSGDGGPAINAQLDDAWSLAVPATGDVYIADVFNYRVRKVTAADGTISTVAGNGIEGFSGDGGLATLGSIGRPADVYVDGSGALYIADPNNARLRRVDPVSGVITTVAGGGSSLEDGIQATSALLYPTGVTKDDSGLLYITDSGYGRILCVDETTGVLSILVGGDASSVTDQLEGKPASLAWPDDAKDVAIDPTTRPCFINGNQVWRSGYEDVDITVAVESLEYVRQAIIEYPALSPLVSLYRSSPEDPTSCCRDDMYVVVAAPASVLNHYRLKPVGCFFD